MFVRSVKRIPFENVLLLCCAFKTFKKDFITTSVFTVFTSDTRSFTGSLDNIDKDFLSITSLHEHKEIPIDPGSSLEECSKGLLAKIDDKYQFSVDVLYCNDPETSLSASLSRSKEKEQ